MLAGVILAGGQSSRMGTDKSLLTLPASQLSLLVHCQKQLTSVCGDNVFISGAQHEQGIADVIPHCGPLSGIHAVITHVEMHYANITELLVLAIDMPDLCSDDLNYLLKMGRKGHCLCAFENCFLPLYIPLSNDINAYLNTTLKHPSNETATQPKQGQYALKRMLNLLQGLQIPPLKNTQLNNINTHLQWQQRCAEQPFTKA